MAALTVHRPNGQHLFDLVAEQLGPLTEREGEAVLCTSEGLNTKETARVMGVTPRTAKAHVENAMVKLGAINRPNLVGLAFRQGLISMRGTATLGGLLVSLLVGIALAYVVAATDKSMIRSRPVRTRVTQTVRLRGRD